MIRTPSTINPNATRQVVQFPGRVAVVYRMMPDEVASCRYVARCGHQAKFYIDEPHRYKNWYWCGQCEVGKAI